MNDNIKVLGTFELPIITGVERNEQEEYRIACAQVLPSENGILGEGGFDKLQRYAELAASRGADVVVFPEYFLTGATHDSWRAVRDDAAASPTSPTHPDRDASHFLAQIAEVARKNDIDIVAGTVVELGAHHIPHRQDEPDNDEDEPGANGITAPDPEHDDKLFNTVYYIDRNGKIAGRYTKKRLWHPERSVLSPGHELRHDIPKTFEITTKRGAKMRAGVAVCWDLAFPELFREMFDLPPGNQDRNNPLIGPDIVFAPTCWYATDGGRAGLKWNSSGEAALLDAICLTRAIENECILAMTNIAGPPFPSDKPVASLSEQDAIGVGRTCVCAPFAGCIGRIEAPDEALLLAAVDLRMLEDARNVYRCRHDIRNAWTTTSK